MKRFNIGDPVHFQRDEFHHVETGRVVGVCTYRGETTVDVESADGERINDVQRVNRIVDLVDPSSPCMTCSGSGVIREKTARGTFMDETCWQCRGTGSKTVLVEGAA